VISVKEALLLVIRDINQKFKPIMIYAKNALKSWQLKIQRKMSFLMMMNLREKMVLHLHSKLFSNTANNSILLKMLQMKISSMNIINATSVMQNPFGV
jgi:hypothetical protein